MTAVVLLMTGVSLFGQASADTEAELKKDLYPFYARVAAEYEFSLDEQRRQLLELQKRPVLTWTNANGYMGSVFVWTHGGRPELIGCIGSHQIRPGVSSIFHEFHSLSLKPLQPVKVGPKEWRPARAGVEPAEVSGSPSPGVTDKLRLIQMRMIAREFQGAMKDGDDVTELRLLPQPIFRYEDEKRDILDGAIFAFVWKGTDPEVLLVLEAHKGVGGNRWRYALARFNHRDLWVKRNDKEIWRVGLATQEDNYFVLTTGEKTRAEIRASAAEKGP